MELIQELLLTGAISLLFSFLVAKLVSMALAGDVEDDSSSRSGKEEEGEMVMEESRFKGELRSSGFGSEGRVEFVGEVVKVDEFELGLDQENLEDFVKKCCESAAISSDDPIGVKDGSLGEEVEVVGLEEKSMEEGFGKSEEMELMKNIEFDIRTIVEKGVKDGDSGEKVEVVALVEEKSMEESSGKNDEVDEVKNVEFDTRETEEEAAEVGALEEKVIEDKVILAQDEQVRVVGFADDQTYGIEGVKNDVKEGLFSDEDDWEGIERSELDKLFGSAAAFVGSGNNDGRLSSFGNDVQMQLYGLHKVATEGPCHEPQPMALKFSARTKWNAWQRLGNMSPEVAMEQYITLLSDSVPGWMGENPGGNSEQASPEVGVSGTQAPGLSILPHHQPDSANERKTEELDSSVEGGDVIGVGDPNYVNRDKQ